MQLAVFVSLIAVVPFVLVLANGWVDRDDRANFVENPYYRGLGPSQILWAFTNFHLAVYQPLAWLLLEAEYLVGGLEPWVYHLCSLALHMANAVALMALAVAILKRCPSLSGKVPDGLLYAGAAASAALFAVHPLRVEAVAWASCQPYLPCAFFAMISVLAYLRRDGASGMARVAWLAASFALYVAAMLCKASAVPLPAVLLLLDAFPLRRFSIPGRPRRAALAAALAEKVPFLAVSLIFVLIAASGKSNVTPWLRSDQELSIVYRIARACYGASFCVAKTIWPSGLAAVYEWPEEPGGVDSWLIAGTLAVVALTLSAIVVGRRRPGLLTAWLAFLALVAPVSSFVRTGYAVVADRYTYVSTIPLFVALAYPLARVWGVPGPWRRGGLAVLLVVVGVLGSSSWRLSRTWRDSDAMLVRAADAGAITRPTYLVGLGESLVRRGRYDEAEALLREAASLAPHRPDPANALGSLLARRGRKEDALDWLSRAVDIEPRFLPAYNNLGLVLASQGRFDEAAERFGQALRIDPYYIDATLNLGSVLRDQGRPAEAAECYARILRFDPRNARARSGLAEIGGWPGADGAR